MFNKFRLQRRTMENQMFLQFLLFVILLIVKLKEKSST